METCNWAGSRTTYVYEVHLIGTNFNAIAANYIFAKRTGPRLWGAVYIGETGNLSERFDSHHKIDCIRRNGATHIHVRSNPNGIIARRQEEAELIVRFSPLCND